MRHPRRPRAFARRAVHLALLGLAGSLGACASSGGRLPPAPPFSGPRPPLSYGLTPARVVAIAMAEEDPAEAIRRLDGQPFAFDLDDITLGWLGERVDESVLDYLLKRSRIDWEELHGVSDAVLPVRRRRPIS